MDFSLPYKSAPFPRSLTRALIGFDLILYCFKSGRAFACFVVAPIRDGTREGTAVESS